MNKLTAPIVAVALLAAACTGTATISGSSVKSVTSPNAVQLQGAVNAGDENADITNRPNPPIHKGGRAPVAPQTTAPNALAPQSAVGRDRCSGGTGTSGGGANTRAGTSSSGKHLPLPMCMPE